MKYKRNILAKRRLLPISVMGFLVWSSVAPASADEAPAPVATEPVADSSANSSEDPWFVPTPHNAHPWLTALELSVVIAGGLSWYWIDRERQVADWDYPGWEAKLTFQKEIFIFDNNPFNTNYSWHTFAGGASHVLGRANGLGIYQAALMGTGASLAWEYGIESRELISLNDLLITNTTGVAVGEFFHRLGEYSRTRDDGLGWDVLRWTLGVSHSIHDKWDRSLHEEPKLWPEFRFSYGLSTAGITRQDDSSAEEQDDRKTIHDVAMDGRFVAAAKYMQPGERSGVFHEANFSEFKMRFSASDDGTAVDAYGDTFLVGYRSENVPEKGDGKIGHAYNVGTSIGYRYQHAEYGIWEDSLGGLHIPGLAAEGQIFGDSWRLRLRSRFHLDLMGVNALSSDLWLARHLDEENGVVGKSILNNSGYYYAWGLSGNLKAELELPRITIGTSLFIGDYYSIEGFDRIRDELAYEVRANNDFLDVEAWLRARVYENYYAEAHFTEQRRDGQLGEFFDSESLQRITLQLGAAF